ncbi:uncharacterized protein EDB93DRAFT_1076466, partial [Suillus bovinus]|uniref:uncharacterized protein n=1 Tax=Suillus bovinus TaxID=48563 RepID=UPI001B8760AD
IHICVKHAFATLKGHFQSLKELRHPMQNQKDLQINLHWVRCCLILYNMIIHFEAQHRHSTISWAIKEGRHTLCCEFEEGDSDKVIGDRSYEGTPGQACRARLMDQLLDSPYSDAQHREG